MKGNSPYLVVNGLKNHYGNDEARIQVLDGVTTTVNKGEICVMLGPSGSGKSTFLNLIGGLEGADGGTIHVGDCEITSLSAKNLGEYRRRELGFVFQFYNLVPDLTIQARTSRSRRTCPRKPLNIDDLLRSLGLYEHRNKFPAPGLGRPTAALRHRPCAGQRIRACCLCDEPTGALDYKTSKEIPAAHGRTSTAPTAAPSSLSPTMPPSRAWPIACCACATGASSEDAAQRSRPSRPLANSIGRRAP